MTLVPRILSEYVECKAQWDCGRRKKSRPDRLPSYLILSPSQSGSEKDWGQNSTKQGFFIIKDNYDKSNANEATHTSFIFRR